MHRLGRLRASMVWQCMYSLDRAGYEERKVAEEKKISKKKWETALLVYHSVFKYLQQNTIYILYIFIEETNGLYSRNGKTNEEK